MRFNNTTLIIGGIIVIGILGLLGYVAFVNESPGTLIAGLLGFIGSIKAKLFGKSVRDIKTESLEQRKKWAEDKEEEDRELKELLDEKDYHDNRSAQISKYLKEINLEKQTSADRILRMTNEEKEKYFKAKYGMS